MPRQYTTSAVAHTLGKPAKWLDNILTHHEVQGVEHARQGIRRKLSHDAITTLYVAKILMDALGAPANLALSVAGQLRAWSVLTLASGLTLTIDHSALAAELDERVLTAVQAEPPRARGRPPRTRLPTPRTG